MEANFPRRTTAVLIGERKMKFRIRDIIGDLIGAISIFAIGYGLMLIGYGVGL